MDDVILPPSPDWSSYNAPLPSLPPPSSPPASQPSTSEPTPLAFTPTRRSTRLAPTVSSSSSSTTVLAVAGSTSGAAADGEGMEGKSSTTACEGSGRPLRRGKENIPPLSLSSSSPPRLDQHAMDVDDDRAGPSRATRASASRGAGPATPTSTLKRSRTPSTLNLASARQKLVRTDSHASRSPNSPSFSSAPSTPVVASASTSSIQEENAVELIDMLSDPSSSVAPLPTPPRRSIRPVPSTSQSTTTPEPPRRNHVVRTRKLPEFELHTPPKTPSKNRQAISTTPTKRPSATENASPLKASLYARAKTLLRCSSETLSTASSLAASSEIAPTTTTTGALIGRSVEYLQLLNFLHPEEEDGEEASRTMYIAGPPGTGKTALLSRLADQQRDEGVTVGVVNCFTAGGGGAKAVWERVGEELFGEKGWKKGAGKQGVVRLLAEAKGEKYILILDELDSLVSVPASSSSSSQSTPPSASQSPSLLLLQTLFLLPGTSSNLSLLAISNTLDFASRYLSNLARPPRQMAFAAYNAGQMGSIILNRLATLHEDADDTASPVVSVIEEKAVELAARKVMAENGDLRVCLDVVRLAVELVEAEWRKIKVGLSTPTKGGPSKSDKLKEDPPIKKAGMTHVLKALQKAKAVACVSSSGPSSSCSPAGSSSGVKTPTKKTVNAGTVQKIQNLNIQSRLILVALLIHSRRSSLGLAPLSSSAGSLAAPTKSSAGGDKTTSGGLLSTYSHLLTSSDSPIHPLNPSDFHTLLSLLADSALLSLSLPTPSKRRGGGVTPAASIVQLSCLEEEVLKGLVGQAGGGGGVEEEEARRILEREEARMERLKGKLAREKRMEKECPIDDRL